MKKILAIIFLGLSSTVFAGSATVEYRSSENQDNGQNTSSILLSVRENITKEFSGDVVFVGNQNTTTNGISGRIETGLIYSTPMGPVNFSFRTALGKRFTNTSDNLYYSVQPTVSYKLTGKTTASLGYRFRDGLDSTSRDQTNTIRLGLSYDLTKTDRIGVKFDRVRGDSNSNLVGINYTRRF